MPYLKPPVQRAVGQVLTKGPAAAKARAGLEAQAETVSFHRVVRVGVGNGPQFDRAQVVVAAGKGVYQLAEALDGGALG